MGISAGNLRDRITILRPKVVGRAGTGERVIEYEPVATVRAQVLQQRSAKAFNNGENWYPTARSFRLRMPPEVKGGWRIIHRGDTYVALPAKVFTRDGFQEVDCELLSE